MQTSQLRLRRKLMLQRIKKGYEDKHLETEGVINGPGMGDDSRTSILHVSLM